MYRIYIIKLSKPISGKYIGFIHNLFVTDSLSCFGVDFSIFQFKYVFFSK